MVFFPLDGLQQIAAAKEMESNMSEEPVVGI
jgi:hypothetical protein